MVSTIIQGALTASTKSPERRLRGHDSQAGLGQRIRVCYAEESILECRTGTKRREDLLSRGNSYCISLLISLLSSIYSFLFIRAKPKLLVDPCL